MPITYSGPFVSPVFVAGVVNDAWDQATALVARARATQGALSPNAVSAAALATLAVTPALNESLPALPAAGSVTDFGAALTAALAAWIDAHFPDTTLDAAAAWARIVATFTSSEQTAEMVAAADRIGTALEGFDSNVTSTAASVLSDDLGRVQAAVDRNTAIVNLRHRKAIDLSALDVLMRTQMEALQAARDFVVEAILGLGTRESQEAARITAAQQRLQDAYFGHLNARVEQSSVELDRLALGKRITANVSASTQDRATFIFRETVRGALAQLESLAHQAQGAINRVHASAATQGTEQSP